MKKQMNKQGPITLTFADILFPFSLREDPQDFVALTQLPRAALGPAPLTAAGAWFVG